MRTARQRRLLLRLFCITIWTAVQVNLSFAVNSDEIDGPNNRKLLGSSVVTSVSVIMDHPNGTKTYITDGEPEVPPTVVGSPAALMSPDRYEFYSFGKDGELVKKLMTLDQIQGLIAGGDELNHEVDGYPANFYQQPLVQAGEPEGVNKVLERVQNVLKSEMETAHVPDHLEVPPMPDDSWSILFPGLFNGDFDFKESTKPTVRPTPASKKPAPPPFPSTTPTRPLMSSTLQAVRVTTPRQPITSSSKSPERPSQQTTARQPPQSLGTTTKYSAHYSTPPPNLKNKPVTVVKKPTGSQPKPQQPVKNTMPRPTTNGTASASFFRPVNTSVAGAKNNATTAPSLKVPNATVINTTSKPTTMKGTTEKMKPSGIPTITHYLPVQTSIGPSEAVKTVKPAIPTKPTIKTTPRPVTKPMNTKPYLKTNITMVQPTNKPITLPSTTTKSQPVAEKLVQKQPANPVLQGSSSEIVRVSVSTPSGPPSTLKMTALTTAKPLTSPTSRPNNSSTVRPVTTPPKPVKPLAPIKAPQVSVQPNRTSVTTPRPATSQKREPVNTKPRPTPAVSTSSVATHKPVLVMTSKPLVKTPVNSNVTVVFTTRAPTGTTKYVPPATATQSRLSTTAMPMKTTITTTSTTTRPPITTTGATTQADATVTLSNELDQVPLKLAASLKEPQQNVFEQVPLMSTTLKEVPTMITSGITTESTTTKWEHNTNVNSAEQTTINSATSTSFPPEASTMTAAPSTVMTEVPTTLSKVYIINNSEPQKIQLPIKAGQKRPQDEPMASTVAEWVNSRPEAQTTESLSPTSTSSDAPTTVTEAQSTTTFKDQVMEDGINAVASILLDDKVAVDKSTLAERLAMPASQPETLQTTEITTATQPETTANDLPAFREEPDIRTSTRRNEDSGRTTTTKAEKTTWTTPPPTIVTSAPTIVTTEIEITTTPSPTTTNSNAKTTSEQKRIQTPALASPTTTVAPITTVASTTAATSKMPTNATTAATAFKKEELRKPQPVKESKLNPDSDEQPQESQVTSVVHQMSTEGTTIIMEQVKLTEKVPVTHAPPPMPAPTVKVPLQEPKLPSPALKRPSYSNEVTPPPGIDLHPAPYESMGAEASTAFLAEDVRRFADLCNELAFRLWTATTSKGQISSRSLVMSPFAAISLLAMVFLGARGATSGQMNEILRLDDMVTFNPHQVLQNVTDSVINSRNLGVATAAFVRQLYSDKSKGKILDFYKERAQQYYGGHVEEVSFATVGDVVRRRTNLLVKRQTLGKVPEYLRGSSLNLRPPLAAFSANIFQTDCESGSTEGRDGEMYFVVRPSTRQRRLVPVPAVVWRSGFSAGYEPSLDATSVCLGQDSIVSTLLILPGQQGQVAPGDGLARLEQRLIETSYRRGGWSRLLRSLLIRPGLELQVPRFSHRSVLNVTSALARMGLRDLFSFKADLRGLNGGVTELHLSDMVQVNTFSTCGEEVLGARHHIETYPASPQRTGREEAPLPNYLDDEPHYEPRRPRYHFNGDDFNDGRPRTGRLPMAAPSSDPAPPRLRFDRPFLYIVRHNPSGIILHIGRFNPRLLP